MKRGLSKKLHPFNISHNNHLSPPLNLSSWPLQTIQSITPNSIHTILTLKKYFTLLLIFITRLIHRLDLKQLFKSHLTFKNCNFRQTFLSVRTQNSFIYRTKTNNNHSNLTERVRTNYCIFHHLKKNWSGWRGQGETHGTFNCDIINRLDKL